MSDLLSGVSSYYDTYTKNNISADKMKDKLSSDYTSATDDEMMEVCKEFEAYFTEQVFKAMQKMVPARLSPPKTLKIRERSGVLHMCRCSRIH